MKLEVTQAYPTLIGRLQIPDAEAMNRDLQALILAEESKYSSLGRSKSAGGTRVRTSWARATRRCLG